MVPVLKTDSYSIFDDAYFELMGYKARDNMERERSKDIEGGSSGIFEGSLTDVAGIDYL